MMRRKALRGLGLILSFASIGVPLSLGAQQPPRAYRIGYMITPPLESAEARTLQDALRQGLREHGYVEGRNIVVEVRSADGNVDRFPSLAAELVRLKVDLIIAGSPSSVRAAQHATRTVPIVAPVMGDPVAEGLVASLSKPGGNITGSTFLGPELVPKRLQLLKEALPRISRVAALVHTGAYGERATSQMLQEAEVKVRTLGLQLEVVRVRNAEDLDHAFSEIARRSPDALIVFPSPMFFSERRRIAELAATLPSIYAAREFAELGGLLSYGASVNELLRQSATYVDRILKGSKPADLPVEQPTKFELVVNLKTAKALGLTIPQAVLVRADEVIQ